VFSLGGINVQIHMSITAINSNSIARVSGAGSAGSDIASLEKQIQSIEKQVQTENASKDDPKTKAKMVTLLENEIEMLQAEIAQKPAQQKQAAAQATSNANPMSSTSSLSSAKVTSSAKISAASSYDSTVTGSADNLTSSVWQATSYSSRSFSALA
jgi:hypothetical protein